MFIGSHLKKPLPLDGYGPQRDDLSFATVDLHPLRLFQSLAWVRISEQEVVLDKLSLMEQPINPHFPFEHLQPARPLFFFVVHARSFMSVMG